MTMRHPGLFVAVKGFRIIPVIPLIACLVCASVAQSAAKKELRIHVDSMALRLKKQGIKFQEVWKSKVADQDDQGSRDQLVVIIPDAYHSSNTEYQIIELIFRMEKSLNLDAVLLEGYWDQESSPYEMMDRLRRLFEVPSQIKVHPKFEFAGIELLEKEEIQKEAMGKALVPSRHFRVIGLETKETAYLGMVTLLCAQLMQEVMALSVIGGFENGNGLPGDPNGVARILLNIRQCYEEMGRICPPACRQAFKPDDFKFDLNRFASATARNGIDLVYYLEKAQVFDRWLQRVVVEYRNEQWFQKAEIQHELKKPGIKVMCMGEAHALKHIPEIKSRFDVRDLLKQRNVSYIVLAPVKPRE